ncbi:MAG: DUF4197 family protein [Chryseobacterium sp.]|nr:MAG: DUF4197 family protein [Chryseobacterium sp.]
MKKIIFPTACVVLLAASSCEPGARYGTAYGVNYIKNVLLTGTNNGLSIWKNPSEFIVNAMIDEALPQELRDLNRTLESIGMGALVKREKQYIAEAAMLTAETARPILVNAIKEITPADAIQIATGGRNAATELLRQRTEQRLLNAIQPQVEAKLNEVGFIKTMNNALGIAGKAGSIFGTGKDQISATSPISYLAAKQMVNGLFRVVEQNEERSRTNIRQLR